MGSQPGFALDAAGIRAQETFPAKPGAPSSWHSELVTCYTHYFKQVKRTNAQRLEVSKPRSRLDQTAECPTPSPAVRKL